MSVRVMGLGLGERTGAVAPEEFVLALGQDTPSRSAFGRGAGARIGDQVVLFQLAASGNCFPVWVKLLPTAMHMFAAVQETALSALLVVPAGFGTATCDQAVPLNCSGDHPRQGIAVQELSGLLSGPLALPGVPSRGA